MAKGTCPRSGDSTFVQKKGEPEENEVFYTSLKGAQPTGELGCRRLGPSCGPIEPSSGLFGYFAFEYFESLQHTHHHHTHTTRHTTHKTHRNRKKIKGLEGSSKKDNAIRKDFQSSGRLHTLLRGSQGAQNRPLTVFQRWR